MAKGFYARVALLLSDMEPHEISEGWDWIKQAIAPEIAVRAVSRRLANAQARIDTDPEWAVEEGRVQVTKTCLQSMIKKGLVLVDWPRPITRYAGSPRFLDPRQAITMLTVEGHKRLLSGKNHSTGVTYKVLREGVQRGTLQIKVIVNGNSI